MGSTQRAGSGPAASCSGKEKAENEAQEVTLSLYETCGLGCGIRRKTPGTVPKTERPCGRVRPHWVLGGGRDPAVTMLSRHHSHRQCRTHEKKNNSITKVIGGLLQTKQVPILCQCSTDLTSNKHCLPCSN